MKETHASCLHCGEPVQYNRSGRILVSTGKPQAEGWAHSDAMRRDHVAFPSDVRSPEEDIGYQHVGRAMARVEAKGILSSQFLEHAVNEAMRDVQS